MAKKSSRTQDAIRRLEGLRKDATRTLTTRLPVDQWRRFTAAAEREHLKPGQLLRKIVLDWMEAQK